MPRRILTAALLVAAGAGLATLAGSWWAPAAPPAPEAWAPRLGRIASAPAPPAPERAATARAAADLERRIAELETRLAAESAERLRLQQRLDEVGARLAAGGDAVAAVAAPAPAEAPGDAPPGPPTPDWSKSEQERALIAAGLDEQRAAELKRQGDALAMAEMYLRDQATREGWLDTPRFEQEMAALEGQRLSVRDEVGDDGYDRYLYALGRTNRVRVADVLADSPAAQAGLQFGDMILRYGDDRVFAPDELVEHTRRGELDETVPLLVVRQGTLMTVEVPRGPLGLRIDAVQDVPQG